MDTDYRRNMTATGTVPGPECSNHSLCIGDAEIPLFDLTEIMSAVGLERKQKIQAFGDALKEVGFVAIKAEEITPLIKDVTAQMAKYFDQDHKTKMKDDHHNHYQTGFWPPGMEGAAGSNQPDNKETYFIPPDYKRWPEFTSQKEKELFQTTMEAYQKVLTQCYVANGVACIAEYLGEPTEDVSKSISAAHNLLRLAHYFATDSDAPWSGAHFDLNLLTLLPPAEVSGLQLRTKSGEWKKVNVPPGYLILNTGQQLEMKTAGKIKATLHRVVKPEGEAVRRLASIFFASFSTYFSLKPFPGCAKEMTQGMSEEEAANYLAHYPDVTVEENLLSRLIEMGSVPKPERADVEKLLSKGLLRQPPDAIKKLYPDLF